MQQTFSSKLNSHKAKMNQKFQESVAFWIQGGYYYGFAGEILKELSLVMNFTIPEISWENSTGFWDPKTSRWTGLIGKLQRREADMGVHLILFGSDRYSAVSFTSPVASVPLKLHYRKYSVPYLAWNTHFKVREFQFPFYETKSY